MDTRTRPCLLALLLVCGFTWPVSTASAQTQAILTNVGAGGAQTASVDLDTGRVSWQMLALSGPLQGTHPLDAMAVSSDGRFAVWSAMAGFFLAQGGAIARNLVSGAITTSLVPSYISDLVAHPRRPMMFGTHWDRGTVLIIEPSGLREAAACTSPFDTAITLDGAWLFIACAAGQIVVFDTAREVVVRRFQTSSPVITIEVDRDGSRVWVLGSDVRQQFSLGVYDGVTGAHRAWLPVPSAPPCCPYIASRSLKANAERTEIYAGFQFYTSGIERGETRVYGLETLAVLATFPRYIQSIAFTPDGRSAVALWTATRTAAPCSVLLIDARAHVVMADRPDNCYRSSVAIVSPPLPPAGFQAQVSRGDVFLRWQLLAHSPMATGYRIEASLDSGGEPMAVREVGAGETALGLPAMPRGIYHVRVRAVNAAGVSGASTEQRVVVP